MKGVFLSDNTHIWRTYKEHSRHYSVVFLLQVEPDCRKKSCSTTHQTCLNLIRNAFNLALDRELLQISYIQTRNSLPLFIPTEFQEQSTLFRHNLPKINFHLKVNEQNSSFYLDKPLHSNTPFLKPL